eukprot:14104769-Alexandrium_andersonii.AAC.1
MFRRRGRAKRARTAALVVGLRKAFRAVDHVPDNWLFLLARTDPEAHGHQPCTQSRQEGKHAAGTEGARPWDEQ